MEQLLQKASHLSEEILCLAKASYSLYEDAKECRNLYTQTHPLTPSAKEFFGVSNASLQSLLQKCLTTWKEEQRISPTGRTIRLGEEASLFGVEKETEVDVYTLYGMFVSFFSPSA
jgi:hypothetical protein